ncbi:MAG TPA: flagellar basal-body rod protein FlgG [Hungateiclostridium thermocellum]|jgi:flagellar basal-body rod protein FlgG|uniref:Flagellar basal-body rod protein FlgG n=2 Tax=Acetivibrio thermocellus TaxID=1515 RepID=A3DIP2_ACET2|nr:flagellar basal-body rod protein FlgG [Acetivibrio thermocellus]CDG37084.1 Flagellar basal-body rod protein FlgG [Acetivibrio thermocellus BC1]ABN53821.1 flagellar hook-basal body protein [Acetivibrio thermocellus ATCC 27405]ADU73303.1 flagellar hook-basal body protein [Acetivibrio thermocellus DSM 1313]ALX07221.1 flagellar basal-body rod protein FlgG [Acetivibrio thermocellus AD2]ANV74957.1 flagellar basal-body rod protein FlgG [Acetivibrio thermocellus DSM 2360]
MMRALWTAGSGMTAQQLNVDVIANNLSNVNTTAYKKERLEFKDMLYDTLNRAYILDGEGRPVNLQVGYGTVPMATLKNFQSGNFEKTDNPLDLAIDGDGFFMVLGPRGDIVYTRDGSFKISVTENGNMLTTSDGYPVLDESGVEIILDIDISKLNVSSDGELSYTDENGVVVPLGQRIGLVKFPNRNGLESIGSNFYASTSASGEAVPDEELGKKSNIRQYYLESSNVQVVEEMVKLIVAQRAYEINSKAIQSADEMLGIANNLKR